MIELYELAATDDKQVFSPYCWRIRLALHHKGLPFKSIPWRMTEKDRIAFADTERVPVLVDGEQKLVDSWKILEYLDERYPAPSLEMNRAELRFFRHWTEMVMFPGMIRMIVDESQDGSEKDRDFSSDEKAFGMPLEICNKVAREFRKSLNLSELL